MSTGIGRTQRRILRLVRDTRGGFLTTAQIAERVGCSQQQAYRAVRSLAARGCVELTLEPKLRVWNPGATGRRRAYWRSEGASYAEQALRRPAHCGPCCDQEHVGCDKQHWA